MHTNATHLMTTIYFPSKVEETMRYDEVTAKGTQLNSSRDA